MKHNYCTAILALLVMISTSCAKINLGDTIIDVIEDPVEDAIELIIGALPTAGVYRNVYSTPLEVRPTENRSNTLNLDVDEDQVDDIKITHTYEHSYKGIEPEDIHTRRVAKTRILLTPFSENFQLCILHVVDTTYSCDTDSPPEYDNYEYTENLGYVCDEEKRVFKIAQIIKSEYAKTFTVGDTLNADFPWYSGHLKFCKQEYIRDWDDMHMSTGTDLKDIRLGLKNWNSSAYVGFRKTVGEKEHFGYLKLKMVQIEDYSWRIQVLETVMLK